MLDSTYTCTCIGCHNRTSRGKLKGSDLVGLIIYMAAPVARQKACTLIRYTCRVGTASCIVRESTRGNKRCCQSLTVSLQSSIFMRRNTRGVVDVVEPRIRERHYNYIDGPVREYTPGYRQYYCSCRRCLDSRFESHEANKRLLDVYLSLKGWTC